jgi:hypothetical protein
MNGAYITKHVKERATERFGVNAAQAEQWVRQKLSQAKHVGNILSGEGEERRFFAAPGVGFVVELERDRVITCVEPRPSRFISDKVNAILQRELQRVIRLEKRITRRNELKIAELNVALAEGKLRLLRARKHEVICEVRNEINCIESEIASLQAEIQNAKIERCKLVKGAGAYA